MTDGEKATAVLNYLEDLESASVINILNPLLDDEQLAYLYDQMKEEGWL